MRNKLLQPLEEQILDASVIIWNRAVDLESQHPDHLKIIQAAVHQIQMVMATRIVQRKVPNRFPIKSNK